MMFYNAHSHLEKENAIVNILPNEVVPEKNFFSSGIHPWYFDDYPNQLKRIETNISLDNCLAIGECGLDRLCKTEITIQESVFKIQIELANRHQKPLIIHCVKAFDLLQGYLKSINVPVIIHGFNQNTNILDQFLKDKNVSFSLGAALLKETSNAQKAITTIPLDRVFFETDNNSKIDIMDVYKKGSELLKLSIENLSNQIEKNFTKTFIRTT